MSLILDEHREYLGDAKRIDAYRRAIAAAVRPGDVVVDLASGTGILGLIACQAGAARVYAIEQSGLVGLARDVAATNGFAERITVIREFSTRAALPEQVDCVVCDQIGHFGFEAGVFEFLDDARRWLKPGGRMVPQQIELWIAAVEQDDIRRRVEFWSTRPAGFDFAPAMTIARNSGYPVTLEKPALLTPAAKLTGAMFPCAATTWLTGDVELSVVRDGVLDGIGGWFRSELADGVMLTNEPGHHDRIGRRNVVLPASNPVRVSAGDCVHAAIRIRPLDLLVTWTITVQHQNGESSSAASATTFAGMLLSSEDLARTRPGARPRLTRAGEARRLLLQLLDGAHTIDEIESELQRAFPDLLPSRERTAEFVAEVVSGYAR